MAISVPPPNARTLPTAVWSLGAAVLCAVAATATAPAQASASAADVGTKALHRAIDRRAIAQIKVKPRRCKFPRTDLAAEQARLRAAGYRAIRFLGGHDFQQNICIRILGFSACRGRLRYRVSVRYQDGRRFVSRTREPGFCLREPRRPGTGIRDRPPT